MTKEEVLRRLDFGSYYSQELPSLKPNGSDRAQALCPFHGDTRPSLSVNLKTGSFRCYGCGKAGTVFDFHMTRHDLDFTAALKELSNKAGITFQAKGEVVAAYDYVDEAGDVLFQVLRYEAKDFRQRRPDGKGGWIWNLEGVRLVPYSLPEVIKTDIVFIVEGEKDVEILRESGLVASCNPMGAGKWRQEYNKHFREKHVAIMPDNDNPGRDHALQIAENLHYIAASVKIVELPGLPEKGDVSDWIQAGGTKDKLLELISKTPEWEPETPTNRPPSQALRVVSVREFLSLTLPPRQTLMSPWLPSQGLCMVYGYRGLGKTYLLLGVAVALSSGGTFLKWSCKTPTRVLYIDGEMPGPVMQERLANVIASAAKEPLDNHLQIITPDLQESGIPDLSTMEGQAIINPYAEQAQVMILDNISTLCRTGAENKGEDWGPVQAWALGLRRKGVSVIFVHHEGKNGYQRGTSRREDVLDTVIKLKRPGDHTPTEGLRVEVHFEKARGIYGEDVKPFEAALLTADGALTWKVKDLEDSLTEKVADLLNERIPQVEIPELLGVSKGTVSKHKKKAGEMGLLK